MGWATENSKRTLMRDTFQYYPPKHPLVGKPRKIANNTFLYVTEKGETITRLYDTDIVIVDAKSKVTLNSGGYRTITTKDRMNAALQTLSAGWRIWQEKGLWFVSGGPKGTVPYYDGMVLPDALQKPEKGVRLQHAEEKLLKQINSFLTKTMKAGVRLPVPDSGDCWKCAGVAATGKSPTCLQSHIQENYLHGRLIINAFRENGYSDTQINYLVYPTDPARADMKRLRGVLRRYLKKHLGLAN